MQLLSFVGKMKNLTSVFVLLFALVFSSSCIEKARFDYYRIYEVTAYSEDHLNIYQQISDYPDGYKFLTNFPAYIGAKSQILVPPHKFGEWSELLEKYNLVTELLSYNYQEDIDKEQLQYNQRKSVYDWSSFKRYEETYAWMNELAARRPNDIQTFLVGKSYEGRDIKGLRINIGNRSGKKSIFFESMIHSNEWIAGSTTTFIINELLTSTDPVVRQLLAHFDWWFVPILNIDGYDYTWNVDRSWRKTRSKSRFSACRGADPNRNWDVLWGEFGGSQFPCSRNYYGDFVFSEVETKQLAEFIETVPNLFGYIAFHSFGRMLMTPYAYTTEDADNLQLLNEIGELAIDSIAQFRGFNYSLGTMNDFFGLVAGSSVDYLNIQHRPTIVYAYELSYSHRLPDREIILTGQEIFASVKTIFKETIARGLA